MTADITMLCILLENQLTVDDVTGLTASTAREGTVETATGLLTCATVGSNILEGEAADTTGRRCKTETPEDGDKIAEFVFSVDADTELKIG